MTSFSSIFASLIKELLIESDMATTDTDMDKNKIKTMGWSSPPRTNRGWYIPPAGRGRGLKLLSPPSPSPHASSISIPCQRSMEVDTQPGRGIGLQTSPPRRG